MNRILEEIIVTGVVVIILLPLVFFISYKINSSYKVNPCPSCSGCVEIVEGCGQAGFNSIFWNCSGTKMKDSDRLIPTPVTRIDFDRFNGFGCKIVRLD